MTRPGDGDDERHGWFTRPGHGGAHEASPALHAHAFELSSRGDRVMGLLLEPPAGAGPLPLVLVGQGTEGPGSDAAALALSRHLAAQGFAVALIDLPLYGARAEHKLAACVNAGWKGEGKMAPLAREWAIQGRSDLRRSLDALSRAGRIDVGRSAFMGFGLAADLGALFCADDPQPRAAVLFDAGRREAAPEFDLAKALSHFAPRPALLLDLGAGVPQRLQQTACPTQTRHALTDPADLHSDETRSLIQRFLSEALGL